MSPVWYQRTRDFVSISAILRRAVLQLHHRQSKNVFPVKGKDYKSVEVPVQKSFTLGTAPVEQESHGKGPSNVRRDSLRHTDGPRYWLYSCEACTSTFIYDWKRYFSSPKCPDWIQGPTQSPGRFTRNKVAGREANHSTVSGDEVKNEWRSNSNLLYASMTRTWNTFTILWIAISMRKLWRKHRKLWFLHVCITTLDWYCQIRVLLYMHSINWNISLKTAW